MEIEAFYSKMQAEIASQSYVHSNGQCMIWTGPMKHGTEYGVIRYKDPRDGPVAGHRSKGVHRMAILVSDPIKDLGVPPSRVTSHLCNNSLCINVAHLTLEPQSINNNRSICFSTNKCSGHGQDALGRERPECLVALDDKQKSYLLRQ